MQIKYRIQTEILPGYIPLFAPITQEIDSNPAIFSEFCVDYNGFHQQTHQTFDALTLKI